MMVFITSKNGEDPIKNEGTIVTAITTLNTNPSNTQGQLTLQSQVGFRRISNSS